MAKGNITITKAAPEDDEIQLFDPQFAGFSYGPGGRGTTIDFGPRGGFEPHVWIGPRNHPLLEGLLRERPDLVEGDGAQDGVRRVYVCGTCGKELLGKLALQGHMRSHRPTVVGAVSDQPEA